MDKHEESQNTTSWVSWILSQVERIVAYSDPRRELMRSAGKVVSENNAVRSFLSSIDESARSSPEGTSDGDVTRFCRGFAKGVQYVADRFGTFPSEICLSNDNECSPRYQSSTGKIVIPMKFIFTCIRSGQLRQSKTEPLILDYEQMATMYGVEEAFHHYSITSNATDFSLNDVSQPNDPRYSEHPLERSAKVVVREALRDLKLLYCPVARCNLRDEDLDWLRKARGSTCLLR